MCTLPLIYFTSFSSCSFTPVHLLSVLFISLVYLFRTLFDACVSQYTTRSKQQKHVDAIPGGTIIGTPGTETAVVGFSNNTVAQLRNTVARF